MAIQFIKASGGSFFQEIPCNRSGCGPARMNWYVDSEGVEVFSCSCDKCGQSTSMHLAIVEAMAMWYYSLREYGLIVVMWERAVSSVSSYWYLDRLVDPETAAFRRWGWDENGNGLTGNDEKYLRRWLVGVTDEVRV